MCFFIIFLGVCHLPSFPELSMNGRICKRGKEKKIFILQHISSSFLAVTLNYGSSLNAAFFLAPKTLLWVIMQPILFLRHAVGYFYCWLLTPSFYPVGISPTTLHELSFYCHFCLLYTLRWKLFFQNNLIEHSILVFICYQQEWDLCHAICGGALPFLPFTFLLKSGIGLDSPWSLDFLKEE